MNPAFYPLLLLLLIFAGILIVRHLRRRAERAGWLWIALTRSQQMALLGLVTDYMRRRDATLEWIDCSHQPAVRTTIAELLSLIDKAHR